MEVEEKKGHYSFNISKQEQLESKYNCGKVIPFDEDDFSDF